MFPATLWRWAGINGYQQAAMPLHSSSSVIDSIAHINKFGDDFDEPSQVINMAPVQLEPETRYGPAVAVASHIVVAVYLTVEACQSLHRAYRGLRPSQDTRARVARRNTLLPIFAGLALVSLIRAAYSSVSYAVLSYKVWASDHGVELPTQFYGSNGVFPPGENAIPIYPLQWLSDTPIHLDALEIIAEKTRRFWWGQQVDLGLVSWSMLLAIEGQRRNIPLLWCYQLLAQLVSLAFAQNIFFSAMLLTPSPLPTDDHSSSPLSRYVRVRDRLLPPKPGGWTPHAWVFSTILVLNFTAMALLPSQANTELFKYLVLANRSLSLGPLAVYYILPESCGKTHESAHDAYGAYKQVFRAISVASFVLHTRASVAALAYNAPGAYYHRHSIHLPFDLEQRSAWERTTSAFGRILGATSDHPVVAAAGWDVILSSVSIGFWVATRAIDVSAILESTVPAYRGQERITKGEAKPEPNAVTRGKAEALAAPGAGTPSRDGEEDGAGRRRRGRSRKIKHEDPSGVAYEPSASEAAATDEGDVLPSDELDWESAAVVWGLTSVGGLGVGSAGAFGGECVAR